MLRRQVFRQDKKNRKILYIFGRPFSPFYSLAMQLRERLYRWGILRVSRPGVPVVSVGNLTMGGSGKTPVVQYIAGFLLRKGWHPAIVSRGYGGSSRDRVNIVSDGRRVMLGPGEAGDEPALLADRLPGVPVLTGPARKYPAAAAVEMGADILVLDDGFQHMALGRDLDLVLFNADFLAGNSVVFPGGDLREPVKALNRCHGFVMTGICQRNKERAERFAELLQSHFPNHPVFMAGYRPSSLLFRDKEGSVLSRPLDSLRNIPLFGFCGIAQPENFRATLADLDLPLSGFKSFPDHHRLSDQELQELFHIAGQQEAAACITTEKDFIKLSPFNDSPLPVYALRMEVEFSSDFNTFLIDRINK